MLSHLLAELTHFIEHSPPCYGYHSLICFDDLCKLYNSSLNSKILHSAQIRQRSAPLSLSEILLIEVLFHLALIRISNIIIYMASANNTDIILESSLIINALWQ